MSSASPASPPNSGFGWLTCASAVFVASVIAAVAVPAWQHHLRLTRAQAVAADLRKWSVALQNYAHDHGDWPDGPLAPGEPPPPLATTDAAAWRRVTPIGGYYTWAPYCPQRGDRIRAAIVITGTADHPVSADRRQLLALDRAFDNGELDTGRLRLGYRNFPVLVLEH